MNSIKPSFFIKFLQTLLVVAICSICSKLNATNITLQINDGAGEGLNDSTPATPVGGNNGITIGQQRIIVFEYAAALLEQIIDSNVPITIEAKFDPLTPCSASSGVIGQAGAIGWQFNTPGTPLNNTWYPNALVNALANSDQQAANDITATFNSDVDNNNSCLNNRSFYYGLDGNPGADIDFLTTVLHEIIHGLGFQTLVNTSTGAKASNFNDTYMINLEDHSLNDAWGNPTMNNTERTASAKDDPDLHWTGSNIDANQGGLSTGTDQGHVRMHAPSTLELGSSVAHFSTALSPFELMEPVLSSTVNNIGLARYLLEDLGWPMFSSNAPIISGIMDTTIIDAATTNVVFAVMDNDTAIASVSVTATSSNTSIIQNANLVISGSGRTRQLGITPEPGMSGNAIVTINANDGANNHSIQFDVNVTSNLPPTATIDTLDGSIFYSAPQPLSGTANDPEQGDISSSITWSSTIDGSLSSGSSINPSLSDGSHQITASITDNNSNNDTDIINITVDLSGDADGDGLINQLEISLGTNPEDADSDDDFLSDFNEVNRDGDPNNYTPGIDTDPNDDDTDNDGFKDGTDFAPLDPEVGGEAISILPLWAMILASLLFGAIAKCSIKRSMKHR